MLIQLLVILLIIGVVVWFIGQIGQLDATIKKLIQAVLIIVALLFVLQAFGLLGTGAHSGRTLLW